MLGQTSGRSGSAAAASAPPIAQRLDGLPLTRLHAAIFALCTLGLAADIGEVTLSNTFSAIFLAAPYQERARPARDVCADRRGAADRHFAHRICGTAGPGQKTRRLALSPTHPITVAVHKGLQINRNFADTAGLALSRSKSISAGKSVVTA
jgi:hypothetical protein